jgi:hypothetical protein
VVPTHAQGPDLTGQAHLHTQQTRHRRTRMTELRPSTSRGRNIESRMNHHRSRKYTIAARQGERNRRGVEALTTSTESGPLATMSPRKITRSPGLYSTFCDPPNRTKTLTQTPVQKLTHSLPLPLRVRQLCSMAETSSSALPLSLVSP